MPPRTADWMEDVYKLLHESIDSPQLYFKTLLEDAVSVEDAIAHIIRAYGISDLATLSGVPKQNIIRFLKNPVAARDSTLTRLLEPLGIKVRKELVAG